MKPLLLNLIRFYQRLPHSRSCRFIPTCSEYAYQAIAKYGILKGSLLSFRRIFKCHPFVKGGIDRVE